MEAIYKIKASEIDLGLITAIKSLFKDREVTITVSTELDETEYLTSNPVNEKHLLDNMASDHMVKYSGEEFETFINGSKKDE